MYLVCINVFFKDLYDIRCLDFKNQSLLRFVKLNNQIQR